MFNNPLDSCNHLDCKSRSHDTAHHRCGVTVLTVLEEARIVLACLQRINVGVRYESGLLVRLHPLHTKYNYVKLAFTSLLALAFFYFRAAARSRT